MAGLATGAVALACCIYFTKEYQNVTALQPHCKELIANETFHPYCDNSTFYDIDFGFDNINKYNYTDDVEAKHLKYLLSNCLYECRSVGTRWSVIYLLGAIIMGAFILQSVIITAGVIITPLRMVGIVTQIFCTCGLFASAIVIACFRYNSIGKLAALSLAPARMKEVNGTAVLSDERTFADDGQLI